MHKLQIVDLYACIYQVESTPHHSDRVKLNYNMLANSRICKAKNDKNQLSIKNIMIKGLTFKGYKRRHEGSKIIYKITYFLADYLIPGSNFSLSEINHVINCIWEKLIHKN